MKIMILVILSSSLVRCSLFSSRPVLRERDPILDAVCQHQGFAATHEFCFSEKEISAHTVMDEKPHLFVPEISSIKIFMGMKMEDVRKIWGEPQDIAITNDVHSGNQKWVYFNHEFQSLRLNSSTRAVYFENFLVVGWDNIKPSAD